MPGREVRRMVFERATAVIVTDSKGLSRWVKRGFTVSQAPQDADGGSATPVSADGYFLTADHVIERAAGKSVYILQMADGKLQPWSARVVWRSHAADAALLHIDRATPEFFEWTPTNQWLPPGTGIMHGGIATAVHSEPGRLTSAIPPDGSIGGGSKFSLDIPLQPGDSGGPIVDAYGRLVGINSAVEFLIPMETAIFVSSEGTRPKVRTLERIMEKDRMSHAH